MSRETYAVYRMFVDEEGGADYFGVTSNLRKRKVAHRSAIRHARARIGLRADIISVYRELANFEDDQVRFEELASGFSWPEARAVEQLLIDLHPQVSGRRLLNARLAENRAYAPYRRPKDFDVELPLFAGVST